MHKDPSSFLKAKKTQQEQKQNDAATESLPYGLTNNVILACSDACSKAMRLKEKGLALNPWLRGEAALYAIESGSAAAIPAPFDPPEYSDWLKQFASSNTVFAADVERIFYDLVDKVGSFYSKIMLKMTCLYAHICLVENRSQELAYISYFEPGMHAISCHHLHVKLEEIERS